MVLSKVNMNQFELLVWGITVIMSLQGIVSYQNLQLKAQNWKHIFGP